MRYLSHVDKYLTLKYKYKYKYSGHKYKYKYKYFKMVLEYYSSTSTSTKYYISAVMSYHGAVFVYLYVRLSVSPFVCIFFCFVHSQVIHSSLI